MTCSTKNIKRPANRKISSFIKGLIFLCCVFLFVHQENGFAQVITNSGAAITVTSGTVVESGDLDNASDSIGNNGTINLSGNYYNANAGRSYGNGVYNVKGNWDDFGIFSADTSTVTFNGNGNGQTITHVSNGEKFYNLVINKLPSGTVTHDALNSGNTLSVLNNLNISAGTLRLGTSTGFLNVGARANIDGILSYNSSPAQVSAITGNLGGSGTIDMMGGGLSHLLNLFGAKNEIGTLLTTSGSSSKVDYRGADQTVFSSPNYRILSVSTPGTKTLMGNSIVGKLLDISNGIFNLGTNANLLEVKGRTDVAGVFKFSGGQGQTALLRDTLGGLGLIDMSLSSGTLSHLLKLEGVVNSIDSFASGTGSTVDYIRAGDQNLFISNNYWNLKISGSGNKLLNADISADGVLTMLSGNINTLASTLNIINPNIGAIIRSDGTVIGKLRRAIGITGSNYLYPIGSGTSYNPMKIKFHQLSDGNLTAQFKLGDIGNIITPLVDTLDGNEIWERFAQAYWRLTADALLSSTNYDVNLNYDGFEVVDSSSRIIKRTDGGQFELDGKEDDNSLNPNLGEIRRDSLKNGISMLTTDLGIGKGRPHIRKQPENLDVCEGSPAYFEVRSNRLGKVFYQWQILVGTNWIPLTDILPYSGTQTRDLILSTTDISMNGNFYRVLLADKWGNINISNEVLLTVNKIPRATATPSSQVVCNNETITSVVLGTSNFVDGTTFRWERFTPPGITTNIAQFGTDYKIGDTISGNFVNNTLNTLTVIFTVIPTGPYSTYCLGDAITFTVTVNPTPQILVEIPLADTAICNGVTTGLNIKNPHTFIAGTWNYNLTVSADPEITGAVGNTNQVNTLSYSNTLVNSDTIIHEVRYLFKPNIFNNDGTPSFSCFSQDTTVIVKVTPTLLSTAKPDTFIGGNNISCFEESDGRIDISPKGGYYVRPYVYKWTKEASPVSTVEDPSGLSVGTYSYKVTDLIGCTFEQNVTLTQPDTLVATTTRIDSVSCLGATNGAVYINVQGGSPNPDYSFRWHSPDKDTYNEDLLNARFGIHELTVKDANGCSFSAKYKVFVADAMNVTPKLSKWGDYQVKCFGDSTGTITAYADGNGDKADFRYYWNYTNNPSQNFSDTASSITGLPAGEYTLTVVDAWGCEGEDIYQLREPKPIKVTRTNLPYPGNFDISCPDQSDGVITDTVFGGHTANTKVDYKWTMQGDLIPFSTERDIRNLRAGNYNFNIEDGFSCQGDTIFRLIQPEKMVLDNISISDNNGFGVSCQSSSDGFIDLTLSGGFGEKDYSWFRENELNSFSGNLDQFGLRAGKYHLVVRDQITNCTAEWPFEITQPDTLSLSPVIPEYHGYEISCFDGDNGSIDMNVSGGVSANPYSFSWSSENISGFTATTQNIDTLNAGIYTVVVTDQNNCVVSRTDTLFQPEKLATKIVPATISCYSTNNGAADITVTGGVEAYTYLWSNGETTEDIDSLYTGKYYVDVFDANNCPISDTTFVSEPPEIIITMGVPEPYNQRAISCFGESDATVNSHVYGGVKFGGGKNYLYNWRHGESNWNHGGENDSTVFNVSAGNYILTITDGNLCEKSDSILVEQPFKIKTEVYETNPTCFGRNDGYITLTVRGGTPEYNIDWFTIGKYGQTADSLGVGRYDVLITDLNNCTDTTYGVLIHPDSIIFEKAKVDPKCPDTSDGKIHYFDILGGTQPYELMLYNLDKADSLDLGQGSDKTVSDLYEGRYRMKITDNNLCVHSDTTRLEGKDPICIDTPNAFSPNGDGINDTWIIKDIDLYPEVKVEIYNRWGELIFYAPKGYTKPWDGTFKGRELPIDSYFYVFDLNPNGNKKIKGKTEITGNITIIR